MLTIDIDKKRRELKPTESDSSETLTIILRGVESDSVEISKKLSRY